MVVAVALAFAAATRVSCVEQGHYGHPARKATWLYAVSCDPPELEWGVSAATGRIDLGFHSKEERREAVASGVFRNRVQFSKKKRERTPEAFRDALLQIALRASPEHSQVLAIT